MTNKMLVWMISLGAVVVGYFFLIDGFYSFAALWLLGTFVLFIGLFRAIRYTDYPMIGMRLIGVVVTGYTGIIYILVGLGIIPPDQIGAEYFRPVTPFYASLITFEAFIRLLRDEEIDKMVEGAKSFNGKVEIETGDHSLVAEILEFTEKE